jgi:hypothetical protein
MGEIHAYQEFKHSVHRVITPDHTIEPFFLVPEKLAWIIEPYARELYKKDGITYPHNAPFEQDPGKIYKFRLVYFICTDGAVIRSDVQMTNAYQRSKDAEPLIKHRTNHWIWEDKTKPLPRQTVEGFWLVPEKLWWILAPFAKEFLIKDRISPLKK